MRSLRTFDIVVTGAGPTGLMCGLKLAKHGFRVAVCGQIPTVTGGAHDGRTAALFGASLGELETLGIWERLAPLSAPLQAIRLIDNMSQPLRAPEVRFDAKDIGRDVLGWNIPTTAIVTELYEAVLNDANCEPLFDRKIASVEPAASHVEVAFEDGERIRGQLVAGADGRRSVAREGAGISASVWDYGQVAIATSFGHSRPHHQVSSEFHRPGGPLTVVPLPGRRSSLVWVERSDDARELVQMDDCAFATALEERLQGLLGSIRDIGRRSAFPLSGMIAKPFAAERVALVGEAAHAFPPIGAQGLNLGIRDVATLVDCVVEARNAGTDIGGADLLSKYAQARQSDVGLRTYGVDMLSRSLTSVFLPVNLGRGALLHAIGSVPLLKKLMIKAGMSAPGDLRSDIGSHAYDVAS